MLLDQYGKAVVEAGEEKRNRVSGLKNPKQFFVDALGVRSSSGESITASTATKVPTFWACVSNIATDIATIPRIVHAPLPDGRGFEKLYGNPISQLLRYPSRGVNGPALFESWIIHALVFQSAYIEIVRDQAGRPVELYLLDPISTTMVQREDGEVFIASGHTQTALMLEDVLILHGPGYNAVEGVSSTYTGREVLGGLLGVAELRGSMMRNGLMPSGVLEHPESLSDEAFERLRGDMRKRLQGARNAWDLMILEEGMKYTVTSFDPSKAQLLEFQKASDLDVCRLFRMPPTKVGILDNAHLNNVEELDIQYRTDTLLPWENRIEHELDLKLLSESERRSGMNIQHMINWILRANLATQSAWFRERFNMATISPNEIRAIYGEPAYEGGDHFFLQGAMATVEEIIKRKDMEAAQPEPSPAPDAEPPEPGNTPPPNTEPSDPGETSPVPPQNAERAFIPALTNAIQLCVNVELARIGRIGRDKAQRCELFQKRKHVMVEAISPVLQGYAIMMGYDGEVTHHAEAYADWHALEMAEQDSFEQWQSGIRIQQDAQALIEAFRKVIEDERAIL